MDSSDVIFHNITKGLEAMDELRFTIADPTTHQMMSFQYIPYWAHAFERYRWPATIALQSKSIQIRKRLEKSFSPFFEFGHCDVAREICP